MELDARRMNTARHRRWSVVFMRRPSSSILGHCKRAEPRYVFITCAWIISNLRNTNKINNIGLNRVLIYELPSGRERQKLFRAYVITRCLTQVLLRAASGSALQIKTLTLRCMPMAEKFNVELHQLSLKCH